MIKGKIKFLTNHKKYVNIDIKKQQKYLRNCDDKIEIYENFFEDNRNQKEKKND